MGENETFISIPSISIPIKYGFILTRHVVNPQTNKYWNHCIECIRQFYPEHKIVVIDDNSRQEYVKREIVNINKNTIISDADDANIEYIQSEFLGSGELLPYYYLWKNKYFDYAVIIHDSLFFQTRINFETLINKNKLKTAYSLWNFGINHLSCPNLSHAYNFSKYLKNNEKILPLLKGGDMVLQFMPKKMQWKGCFGLQCFISLSFVSHLQEKYNLFCLLDIIKTRTDRIAIERLMGLLFYVETSDSNKNKSIMGDIQKNYKGFYKFHWKDYERGLYENTYPLIKVWTGR